MCSPSSGSGPGRTTTGQPLDGVPDRPHTRPYRPPRCTPIEILPMESVENVTFDRARVGVTAEEWEQRWQGYWSRAGTLDYELSPIEGQDPGNVQERTFLT